MRKKLITAIIALSLALCCLVGVTMAWLMDETPTVENTFTYGDVTITLKESPVDANGQKNGDAAEGTKNSYAMIPGNEYYKDPTVAVDSASEDCYLFVKFEEVGNASTYLTYTSTLTEANGWKLVDGTTNVWYRVVNKADTIRSWELLAGNVITVNATAVTKENMDTAKAAALKYTAYAVQKANVDDAAAAWEIAQGN